MSQNVKCEGTLNERCGTELLGFTQQSISENEKKTININMTPPQNSMISATEEHLLKVSKLTSEVNANNVKGALTMLGVS